MKISSANKIYLREQWLKFKKRLQCFLSDPPCYPPPLHRPPLPPLCHFLHPTSDMWRTAAARVYHPLLHCFHSLKKQAFKKSSGRRHHIFLLKAFRVFAPWEKKINARINISHRSTALSLDKWTHRTAEVFVVLLISGDREEECWLFFYAWPFKKKCRLCSVKFLDFT